MTGTRTRKTQVRYTLSFKAIETVSNLAEKEGVSESLAAEQIVREWGQAQNSPASDSITAPAYDTDTNRRINELQRTVERLSHKVQELTLKEHLERRLSG